jgi:hydrogenase maturation protease
MMAGRDMGDTRCSDALSGDTLVIGLGNPLRGDDGIGMRVARLLAEQALPEGVEVVQGGTCGLELVNWMEGWRRVLIIDAAEVGEVPGGFARFTLAEGHLLGDDRHLSIHAAGLRDALLLAEVLGVLPDEVIIFGVQPAHLDWDDPLSPEVEAAVPKILSSVLGELGMPRLAARA